MTLVKTKRSQEMPSIFDSFFDFTPSAFNRFSNVPVNVRENEKEYALELAAPGMKKEDFKISLDENVLTVSSEKRSESSVNEDEYTRKEFSYNSFSRSFSLPNTVDADKVKASYNDGVLSVLIPKKAEKKSRLIDIF